MLNIPIILGSTRRDRQSVKVARLIHGLLSEYGGVRTELLDLLEYDLPILEERLRFRDDPPPRLPEFADRIARADGILVVSPEYNHGYPGVLKNALDYLLPEYERKPFGIATCSASGFGGIRCLEQLRLVVAGMGAFAIPGSFMVSKVDTAFDEQGRPVSGSMEGRAREFLDELVWFSQAIRRQKQETPAKAA